MATALASLMSLPSLNLSAHPSPLYRLTRLESALGGRAPRLFIKRDDLLTFGGGGNKVRKLDVIGAEAQRQGADTLITCGALQSNHARVTAATGAALGLRVILVLNTDPGGPSPTAAPVGNYARDLRFGAEIRLVSHRAEREEGMEAAAAEVTARGGRPFVIPMGGSMPLGAMGFARGVAELSAGGVKPDAVVHASSSAATQAGLMAGCGLFGLSARVIGISVDEPAEALKAHVTSLLEAMASQLGGRIDTLTGGRAVVVDDAQVGDGYGRSTAASEEAASLLARREGVLLDPVYTAKAMAGLLAHVRDGDFGPEHTVLFWHTGGLA